MIGEAAMTHEGYSKLLERDADFVNKELSLWKVKLTQAEGFVKKWQAQADAICSVKARVNLSGESAFCEAEKKAT